MASSSVTRRSLMGTAAVPLLAACGLAGDGGAAAPGPDARPANVQFYFSGNQATVQLYQDMKVAFERAHPKSTLELGQGETEIEKLLTLLAAGTPTDVFWNRVRTSQVLIRREGTLADVLPLMKRDKLTQDDFWPSAVKAYTYKGGYFGLPTSSSSSALYFNKALFRQVGLTFPDELEKQGKWNWDTLVDTAKKLTRTDASGKKLWGYARINGIVQTVQFIWQNGGTPFSEDRRQALYASSECIGGVQFMTDLILKHQVTPPVDDPAKADFFSNFSIGMEQGGRYRLPDMMPALQGGSLDAGMATAPAGPKNNKTRGDDLAGSILKSTKVLDAAWAFTKFWASEEGQLIILKSNRSYTSRRSIARNQSILKQVLQPWENGETYFNGLNRTDVFPVPPKFPEVTAIFDREEKLAHEGKKTVRGAMDTVVQEVTPLIKEPF
ncbi:MAG TPA: sugar ABC transporter substrate-binding protein [Chloroflexota bacterium]|nr:sugar ABC transporter substrate-binding protein [Chloroflexota bacterium]